MKIISIRENPEYADRAIRFFQEKWSSVPGIIYEDSIKHSLTTTSPLPQWYLLEKNGAIIGCAGLITNDFISRMDLYPWICAVYIEEEYRGNSYGSLLWEKAKYDSAKAGFSNLYLCTQHIGYYEKFGFTYIGQGYHPWDEESRIYCIGLENVLKTPGYIIREETTRDYPQIYSFIKTAFKTANVKDGDEQDYAVKLRQSPGYIPELALVAESDEKLIGHIMFTQKSVHKPDGTVFDALLLSPLSVLLEYRNKGIGAALIYRGFEIASDMGYKAVFLVGDPNYYRRFGFKQTAECGIRSESGIPDEFVMVKELREGALNNVSGIIDCV